MWLVSLVRCGCYPRAWKRPKGEADSNGRRGPGGGGPPNPLEIRGRGIEGHKERLRPQGESLSGVHRRGHSLSVSDRIRDSPQLRRREEEGEGRLSMVTDKRESPWFGPNGYLPSDLHEGWLGERLVRSTAITRSRLVTAPWRITYGRGEGGRNILLTVKDKE